MPPGQGSEVRTASWRRRVHFSELSSQPALVISCTVYFHAAEPLRLLSHLSDALLNVCDFPNVCPSLETLPWPVPACCPSPQTVRCIFPCPLLITAKFTITELDHCMVKITYCVRKRCKNLIQHSPEAT